MRTRNVAALIAATVSSAVVFCSLHPRQGSIEASGTMPAIVGDASQLVRAYEEWRAEFENSSRTVHIGMSRAGSHVDRLPGMVGHFSYELNDNTARIEVEATCEDLDAWLVANVDGPGRSFMPERGDVYRKLGRLERDGERAYLSVDLSGAEWSDLMLDTIAITRSDITPDIETVLVGQPNVFERVYGQEMAALRRSEDSSFGSGLPLAFIAPQSIPIGAFDPAGQLQSLVDLGEKLFFTETFSGNGRTCGTCHPAFNNFTIDRPFIASLPNTDPLFVAEFDPNLDSTQNGGLMFEQPQLMRDFGLILENLDGFGDLQNRFVMRAVSHTFAQDVQRRRPVVGQSPPKERTGWSGDGAPGTGTLRDFAVGAVTQHFPKTLARNPGSDFILPTSSELDALEAFQLALGRQQDFELSNPFDPNFIAFDDVDAEQGKQDFIGVRCDICHFNAGGNSFFTTDNGIVQIGDPVNFTLANGNFDTGVEMFLFNNPDGTGLPRPFDGGFGTQPGGMPPPWGPVGPIPGPFGEFGDLSFNTPSVVEFADTVPGFHNNITAHAPLDPDPVVAAVLFYRTSEFGNSQSGQAFFGGPIGLGGATQTIARFLRAINAVQNDRNAVRFLARAYNLGLTNFTLFEPVMMRGVQIADSEAEDAIDVLTGFGFAPDPIPNFVTARNHMFQAQNVFLSHATRLKHIKYAIKHLELAEDDLVQ